MNVKVKAAMPAPENATELRLDAPADNLKQVRLAIDFGGKHRGNTVEGGPVTVFSDMETITVYGATQVELRTTSPTIHYVSENVPDLLIKATGWEQSSMPNYHDAYVRAR